MRGHRAAGAAAAGLLAISGFTVFTAPPVAAAACTIDQLTFSTTQNATIARISGDGSLIAFSSGADYEGSNPNHNPEIWRYDIPTQSLFPVTATAEGETSTQISVDETGDHLAFMSTANLTSNNSDHNQEVFRWTDGDPDVLEQLTNTSGAGTGSGGPMIDADGSRVALGSSPTAGPANVYLWDTTGAPVPLTTMTGSAAVSIGAINDAGTRIAYSTTGQPAGTSNPDGNYDAFLYDTSGGGSNIQLTNTTPGAFFENFPSGMNDAGNRVAIQSNRNLAGSGNGDGSNEVFFKNVATGGVTQLTSGPASFLRSPTPTMDGSGSRIVFADRADLTGANLDNSEEIFSRDVGGTNATSQVTRGTTDGSQLPSVSDDGTRVAFVSNRDLTGDNADNNNEVFLATCGSPTQSFSDVPPSNVFFDQIEWMTEVGVASGFPNGTFKPQDAVKRQQMANFLYNLAGQPSFPPPDDPTFNDVPETSPFFEPIEWMVAEGIASGFPDGGFHPQDAVKRQQMANFLYNLAGQPDFTAPGTPTFNDYPPGSTFYDQVEWMADEGIASGFPDGGFHPQEPVKRQQMANFLFNFERCCGVGIIL